MGHSREDRSLLPSPSPELSLTDLGFLRQAWKHRVSPQRSASCLRTTPASLVLV